MKGFEDLQSLMATPLKVVICTHHKPDGDAMGSSLGLYHFLKAKSHQVNVISPTDYPHFLSWLPGNDHVIIYEQETDKALTLIDEADLIFCLDFNQLHRINDMGDKIENAKAKKVLIDHHLDPHDFADFTLSDSKASSTAELVYDFIDMVDGLDLISKDAATCLYVGIMTDTGSFRFSGTTAKVHEITAELIKKGVNNTEAHELIFDSFSENRLRFFGYCITEKLRVLPEFATALITVTAKELNRFKVKTGDTEGLVNYPLAIDGVVLAALIIDRTKLVKLSLRSKGDFPANEIAAKYFKGGGHKNAAGGSSNENLEATVQKLVDCLPEYKDYIKPMS